MSFAVYYFDGAMRVATGDAVIQRIENSLMSGKTSGFVVKAANEGAPIVAGWNGTNFFADVAKAWMSLDRNAVAREKLAAVMGTLAGLHAVPSGLANALAADMIASEAFKDAYNKVNQASNASIPWSEIFDLIDRIKVNAAEGKAQTTSTTTPWAMSKSSPPPPTPPPRPPSPSAKRKSVPWCGRWPATPTALVYQKVLPAPLRQR